MRKADAGFILWRYRGAGWARCPDGPAASVEDRTSAGFHRRERRKRRRRLWADPGNRQRIVQGRGGLPDARQSFLGSAHAFTQIDAEPRILRPINYPPGTPGRGAHLYTKGGKKLLVVNVMGRLFMDPLDDPFRTVDAELAKHRLGGSVDGILIDVHAEAEFEKDGPGLSSGRARVLSSAPCWAHVPSADGRILPKGTAYQTDAGMCGDYNSIIGMKAEPAVARFVRKLPGERLTPAEGDGTICGAPATRRERAGRKHPPGAARAGGCWKRNGPCSWASMPVRRSGQF